MKILAISDLHGNLNNLNITPDIDVVAIAGDFAKLTNINKWAIYEQRKWINNVFINFINTYPNIQFVIVPGNHDLALDPATQIRYPDIQLSINWPKNAHILIDSEYEYNNIRFYGSPYVPIISYRWAFEADHQKLQKHFRRIPYNIDVLITHTPPRIPDCFLDVSLTYGKNSDKFGSGELTEEILNKSPKYALCGHIHTGDHSEFIFNNTKIYNVSRLDESYEIYYEPKIIYI
jgi:Icc-related predicted phosphoesterase